MEKQELEIIIDADGKVNIKVNGVKGPTCEDLTKNLEEAIGEVEKRDYTSDYYENETEKSYNRNNLRE